MKHLTQIISAISILNLIASRIRSASIRYHSNQMLIDIIQILENKLRNIC